MLVTPSLSRQYGAASAEARCLRSFSKRLSGYLASPNVRFWTLAPLDLKLQACLLQAVEVDHDWRDKNQNFRVLDGLIRNEIHPVPPPAKRQRSSDPLPSTSAFSSPPRDVDDGSFFAVDSQGKRYRVTPVSGPGDPFTDASISITRAPGEMHQGVEDPDLLNHPDTSVDEEGDEDMENSHAMKTP